MWETWKAKSERWVQLTPSNALYDRTLLWLFFLFLAMGVVMVASASVKVSADHFSFSFRESFLIKELAYVFTALCIFFFMIQIPMKTWEKYNVAFLIFAILSMVALFVIGKEVKGAVRWIPLGVVNFQPAELAKLAVLCYFANFYVRKYSEMRSVFLSMWKPLIIFGIVAFLFKRQSDTGSIVLVATLIFSMLFLLGAKTIQFVALIIGGIILIAAIILEADYRLNRVTSFLNPFEDPLGNSYQLINSQVAYRLGGFSGEGLGNSIQKLQYLPEAHTDFIMAIVGEEFGFIGILTVIILLGLFTYRGLSICKKALLMDARFRGFFAFGITFWIFIQGFANLGVSSGLLPTKGLTFPLVSYGGSSLMITTVAIAILLRIDHENRLESIGQAQLKEAKV